MPTILDKRIPANVRRPRRMPVTVDAAATMRELGQIQGRYEVVQGDIISKMGQNAPHAFVVRAIGRFISEEFSEWCSQVQLPVTVASGDRRYNEPEPDAAILAGPASRFAFANPAPPDILVVFEVADTSLGFDMKVKAPLYARAQVQEYAVIDLAGRQVFLHQLPGAKGYGRITAYSEAESFSLYLQPELAIPVASLLPPAA